MKTKATFLLIILLTITFSFTASGQGANFSGEWKLNKEKTVLASDQLFLSKVIVGMNKDSLLTSRVYENGNGDVYPFKESLSLDGKECKITIYDMPRTSKLTKSQADGSFLIESKTTFTTDNGQDNLTAKETWKVDTVGQLLTISFTNKMSAGETSGTNYYNKVK
jgi:hypothetical protein